MINNDAHFCVSFSIGKESKTSKMPEVIESFLKTRNPLQYAINCSGNNNYISGPTLAISGFGSDIVAWLELFKEEFPQVTKEIDYLISQVTSEELQHIPGLGYSVQLKDNKEFCYHG